MTYIKKKELVTKKYSSPAKQLISNSYVEITGSRGSIDPSDSNNKIVYKFGFSIQLDNNTSSKWFLHIKLQKN